MEPEVIIAELHRENLCTYFILPLLKINKSTFASPLNFIDSYLTHSGEDIIVKVNDVVYFSHRMVMHPQFAGMWTDSEGKNCVGYKIPARWRSDVELFIAGKFSRMSTDAKAMIHQHSDLIFRVRQAADEAPITDARLLALDRSSVLKNMWESHYNVQLSDEDELLSKPGERSFIDLAKLTPMEIPRW